MAKFYYGRVSSKTQSLARQQKEAQELGIQNRYQFYDKESGKNLNRKEWTRMIGTLREGDILYVNSLDRISRDYRDIQKTLILFKDLNIDLVIMDNPLLDTTKNKDLLGNLIFDLTVSLLGYVAQMERTKIKERQKKGIELTLLRKKQGLAKYGRPKIKFPSDYAFNISLILKGEKTHSEYIKELGVSKSTYFRHFREYRDSIFLNSNKE